MKAEVIPEQNPRYERKTSMRKPKAKVTEKEDYQHLHSQSEKEPEKVEKSSPLASPLPPPEPNHLPAAKIKDMIEEAEQVFVHQKKA